MGDYHIAAVRRLSFLQRMASLAGWVLAAADQLLSRMTLFHSRRRNLPRSAGQVWFNIHVASLNLMQALVQRFLHPLLWDPVIATMLQWPAWSLLGAPLAVFTAIAPN